MKKIVIYTATPCPYCLRAKALLKRKNLDFEEINVQDEQAREKMLKKTAGQRTVPQIFIDDQHIGGSDDLHYLDKSGKLDELLK